MILTTAITWGWELLPLGVLAGTSLYSAWKWRAALNRSLERGHVVKELCGYLDNASDRYWKLWHNARKIAAARIDAEDRLRKIEQQRHLAAKHARQCQLTAQRLTIIGKAAEIRREMGR
jgi:hypothetical protein